MFGCEVKDIPPKLKTLCADTSTIGSVIVDKNLISVFTDKNVFKFKFNSGIESNDSSSNSQSADPLFKNLESSEALPLKKYTGFDPKAEPFFSTNDQTLCSVDVDKNHYNCWAKDGKKLSSKQTICPPEREEPDEVEDINSGCALISTGDQTDCRFQILQKDLLKTLVFEKNKFAVKESKKVETSGVQIIAAIKSINDNWYFITTDGKYCKNTDTDFQKVWICLSEYHFLI